MFAQGVERALSSPQPLAPATIDVNRARVAELALLPGIGRGRAEAIVLHRVRNGSFRRLEDLCEVDGIGAGTVEGLAEFVRVGVYGTLPGHGSANGSGR